MPQSRRSFVKQAALASASLPFIPIAKADHHGASPKSLPKINLFSKHLQFLDFADMAKAAAEIDFDGIDLTVRPSGHVHPENVERDLPKAFTAIKEAGLDCPMITTTVDDADDPVDQTVLKTAASLGIQYYRMNWLRYRDDQSMSATLSEHRETVRKLGELNETLGIIGCYQNHAGAMVGASLWELSQMLASSSQERMGIQYDIRHATVEGGLSWPNGLRLIAPRIKTAVIKDFDWVKKDGETQILNTPVGEGTVDFKRYFGLLKRYEIDVPFSLHLEYELGGAQWGRREITREPTFVYDAMRKDLDTVKKLWKSA